MADIIISNKKLFQHKDFPQYIYAKTSLFGYIFARIIEDKEEVIEDKMTVLYNSDSTYKTYIIKTNVSFETAEKIFHSYVKAFKQLEK